MTSVLDIDFRSQLIAAGLLVPTGADGIYLTSGAYESIAAAIDRLVSRAGADQAAEVLHAPVVMPRSVLEASGFVGAFPDLVGTIDTFQGDDAAHGQILRRLEAGDDRWADLFEPSDVALCPAACHPVYPTCRGRLAGGARRFEVFGHCYRNEPSDDPARLQAFRMHEFVFVGDADGALDHRDLWLERAAHLLGGLGLSVEAALGSSHFFGRAGRLLSAHQRAEGLKHEIVTSVHPGEGPVGVVSCNYHLDLFGRGFGIEMPDGSPAHSACAGFGTERVVLALLAAHGLDSQAWPVAVRQLLWP